MEPNIAQIVENIRRCAPVFDKAPKVVSARARKPAIKSAQQLMLEQLNAIDPAILEEIAKQL